MDIEFGWWRGMGIVQTNFRVKPNSVELSYIVLKLC